MTNLRKTLTVIGPHGSEVIVLKPLARGVREFPRRKLVARYFSNVYRLLCVHRCDLHKQE